jgi:hypothetical protein
MLGRGSPVRASTPAALRRWVADQLVHRTVVIAEGDHTLDVGAAAARRERLVPHAVAHEALEPEAERARQHRERRHRDLARTLAARPGTGPREEGHDAARRADLVAVVQVIGLRIVEVDRALHEAQPEQAGEEIEIALRITRDRC